MIILQVPQEYSYLVSTFYILPAAKNYTMLFWAFFNISRIYSNDYFNSATLFTNTKILFLNAISVVVLPKIIGLPSPVYLQIVWCKFSLDLSNLLAPQFTLICLIGKLNIKKTGFSFSKVAHKTWKLKLKSSTIHG